MTSTIFVSGGHGFLGKPLCKRLIQRGHEVVAPRSGECDLTKATSLDQFADKKFEVIYHLAAWTQAGDFCLRHPHEQWIINQQINTNMVSWWSTQQPQAKFVIIGTSCVYDPELDLTEDNFLRGVPVESLFTYAYTKKMLLVGAMSASHQHNLDWLCAVPGTLYGPNYHDDGRQLHFIFDLARKIIRGKEFGDDVELWGDGHQIRELVHVNEYVDTLIELVGCVSQQVVNIGAGTGHTIREFAELICKEVGYDPNQIKYDTTKYVGAKSKVLNIDKVNALLPSRKRIALEEGLSEMVGWLSTTEIWKRRN